jgi:oxygen-independent coproporphyrinogen-3 oxidase
LRISLKPFWRRDADAEGDGASADAAVPGLPDRVPAVPGVPLPALAHYESALRAAALQTGESLALAVRVPFCAAHCLFCNRTIHAAQPAAVIDRYIEALAREAALVADRIGRDRDVVQLHLGGGSASDLSDVQLLRLVDGLRTTWRVPADAEMSVEVDPRRVSRRQLDLLCGLGFRHVIFGVADLDPAVQCAIGRCQSPALIDDVCALARHAGFERIQLELLVGLPRQTPGTWQATLTRVIAMAPDRVALSPYLHRPDDAPGQAAIDADELPDPRQCEAMRAASSRSLQSAGYRPIGSSRYVLDDDELARALAEGRLRRNLIGYTTTPPVPLIGLGAGALGQVGEALYGNGVSLMAWHAALEAGQLPVASVRPAAAQGALP